MEISNDISSKGNDTVCRVCLSLNEANKCIFTFQMTFGNRDSTGLLEQLQLFGGIKVKHGDGLPSKICDKCIVNVRIAHDFRKQCQESDRKLRLSIEKVRNGNYENLSHNYKTRFAANQKKQSGGLWEFNERSGQILTAPVDDSARITQDRREFCKNAIVAQNIEDKNPLKEADMRRAQSPATFTESDAQNVEKPWNICTKKLDPGEKSEKIKPKSCEENDLVSDRPDRRSRRLTLFRIITSMENLKKCRERQRRYLKKRTVETITNSRDNHETITNSRSNHESQETVEICQASAPSLPVLTPSLYGCTLCCRSYKTKQALDEHRSSHDTDRFSCDRCDERFGKLVEYLEHAKSHDPQDKLMPATCKICKKNFRKTLPLMKHLHVHKRENPRDVYMILKDMRDRRKIDELCKIVDEADASDDVSRLEEYLKKSAVPPADPHFPSRIYSDGDKFLDLSETPVNWEDSEIPSDDTSAIKLINAWIREELDVDKKGNVFLCDLCSKSYRKKKSLLRHVANIHHGSSRCNICQESCTCADKAKENAGDREETKFYLCSVCEKTFEKETELVKHMEIHLRDEESQGKNFKRFLCHICSKTFRQNTGLMLHMRTHTGYKPHPCKYCGRGFTSNSNRTNHERTHTGDRPFVCHFCSAAFAKSCTLKMHITTHTGEANYHCKTCGKSFRRLKYLKEHRFTHTGEKPFACKICGTAYSHSGSLFVHEKKCKARFDDRRGTTSPHADDRGGSSSEDDPDDPNDGKCFIDDLQRIDQIDENINLNVRCFNSNGRGFQV